MTTNARRIQRMYAALSARERVLLSVEERKARGAEDPFVFATTPRDQLVEVNRLLGDVGIVNHELGGVILGLYEATRALEWRLRWFEALAVHAADVHRVDLALKIRGPSTTRLRPPIDVEAPEDETFAGRAPGLLKGVRDELLDLAAQAQATEQILEEFSGELGGDPLRPDSRAMLEAATGRIDALFVQLESWIGPVQRRDDVSEELAMGRNIVAAARRW
jgi:hypothetical protein